MIFRLIFCLSVSLSLFHGAASTPAGCSCGCRPPPPPQSCLPTVPLMLDNCGPNPSPLPPINAPPIQTCVVNKPPITLPACAPPPKTIANTCHCVKTVVKPQIVQQLISVPSVQRYIQTTHQPVVEHIHYQGIPINCPPYAPEAPTPAAPCPLPPACSLPAPCAAPPKPATPPCFALAAAKPPSPAAIHPSILTLLSLVARQAPRVAPACLPIAPCVPVSPPAPAPASIPASITLPPCLLSLLSKLL